MPQTAPAVVNFQQRQATAATVDAQRIVLPQGLVDSHPTTNNYSLVQGHYGDYVNTKPAVMNGSSGTTLGKGTYKSVVQASNIQHTDAVTVHPTGGVQHINGNFTTVAHMAGAKARYTNCRFTGAVTNAGNAADVVLVNCFYNVVPVNCTLVPP